MTATAAIVPPPPQQNRKRGGRPTLTRVLLLLFGFFFVGAAARAQDAAAPAPRPRIGLVLSGGGARGIAHVGVLRWLEEHRIPVDVVAGTSMGGLVGGLYASGLTPDDMLTLVQSADWNQALSGTPSYYDLPFRRKEDRRAVQSDIEFGTNRGKLQGRSGLNPGHEIGLVFSRVTLPYGDTIRFDDLPIPFRCVATDMVAGKEVVLESGSLSTALRATIAIPGIFTLVRRDGRLLGDGGLMNNIPTDIAKQMGADIVIAVNVGTPLSDEATLATIGGVLQQSIAVMTAANQRRNLELAQVVLTPELTGFGVFDFQRTLPLVERGYASAEQNARALTPLALGEAEWQAHIAARRARRKTTVPVPTFITVTGTSRNGAPLVQQRLKPFVGRPIRPETLENELNQLRAQGGYDTLSYETTRRPGDPARSGLLIRVQEKPYAPPFLYPAFIVDGGTAQNRSEIALVSRLVTPNLDSSGAETAL
jgi:NTE family protein